MYHFLPLSFLEWCSTTSVGAYVASSVWSFPILETFHIMGLVLLLGSIFTLSLTMFGAGVPVPPDLLAQQLLPWACAGLLINIGTGIPMFMSAAPHYGTSGPFTIKMALLVLAVLIQTAIHVIPGMYRGSLAGKIASCASLICWFGIAYAGRAIAFPNLLGVIGLGE